MAHTGWFTTKHWITETSHLKSIPKLGKKYFAIQKVSSSLELEAYFNFEMVRRHRSQQIRKKRTITKSVKLQLSFLRDVFKKIQLSILQTWPYTFNGKVTAAAPEQKKNTHNTKSASTDSSEKRSWYKEETKDWINYMKLIKDNSMELGYISLFTFVSNLSLFCSKLFQWHWNGHIAQKEIGNIQQKKYGKCNFLYE